jgi:hypothetical protein
MKYQTLALSPPEAPASTARKLAAAAAAAAANRFGKINLPRAQVSPPEPPRTDRFAQLCALATDPNAEISECAVSDLFHEFHETEPMGSSASKRDLPGSERKANN